MPSTLQQSKAADSGGTGSTSQAITFDSTPTEGNLLVVGVAFRDDDGASDPTISGTGWTLVHRKRSGASEAGGVMFWKIAGSSEPTAVTVSWANSVRNKMFGLEYSHDNGFNGIDVAQDADSGSSTVTSQSTGTTAASADEDRLVVAMFCLLTGTNWSAGRAYTNGLSEIGLSLGGVGGQPGMYVANDVDAAQGTHESTFSTSGSGSAAYGIVAVFDTIVDSDETAPVLTNPTAGDTGGTTASGGATTDEDNGTFYGVASTSATTPSKAQIKAGQDHTGSAAAASANDSVSGTGAQSLNFTGLSNFTVYYLHFMHEDAAGNQSNIVSSEFIRTDSSIIKWDKKKWRHNPYRKPVNLSGGINCPFPTVALPGHIKMDVSSVLASVGKPIVDLDWRWEITWDGGTPSVPASVDVTHPNEQRDVDPFTESIGPVLDVHVREAGVYTCVARGYTAANPGDTEASLYIELTQDVTVWHPDDPTAPSWAQATTHRYYDATLGGAYDGLQGWVATVTSGIGYDPSTGILSATNIANTYDHDAATGADDPILHYNHTYVTSATDSGLNGRHEILERIDANNIRIATGLTGATVSDVVMSGGPKQLASDVTGDFSATAKVIYHLRGDGTYDFRSLSNMRPSVDGVCGFSMYGDAGEAEPIIQTPYTNDWCDPFNNTGVQNHGPYFFYRLHYHVYTYGAIGRVLFPFQGTAGDANGGITISGCKWTWQKFSDMANGGFEGNLNGWSDVSTGGASVTSDSDTGAVFAGTDGSNVAILQQEVTFDDVSGTHVLQAKLSSHTDNLTIDLGSTAGASDYGTFTLTGTGGIKEDVTFGGTTVFITLSCEGDCTLDDIGFQGTEAVRSSWGSSSISIAHCDMDVSNIDPCEGAGQGFFLGGAIEGVGHAVTFTHIEGYGGCEDPAKDHDIYAASTTHTLIGWVDFGATVKYRNFCGKLGPKQNTDDAALNACVNVHSNYNHSTLKMFNESNTNNVTTDSYFEDVLFMLNVDVPDDGSCPNTATFYANNSRARHIDNVARTAASMYCAQDGSGVDPDLAPEFHGNIVHCLSTASTLNSISLVDLRAGSNATTLFRDNIVQDDRSDSNLIDTDHSLGSDIDDNTIWTPNDATPTFRDDDSVSTEAAHVAAGYDANSTIRVNGEADPINFFDAANGDYRTNGTGERDAAPATFTPQSGNASSRARTRSRNRGSAQHKRYYAKAA